jgi:hypothetical protein
MQVTEVLIKIKLERKRRDVRRLSMTLTTAIEGNRIRGEEVERFIRAHPKPTEQDELEIVGYYNSLVQDIASKGAIEEVLFMKQKRL